jgi:sterol desaturase/sphingolipid hydroxylase (fatty acid hydroxylase superfamily)
VALTASGGRFFLGLRPRRRRRLAGGRDSGTRAGQGYSALDLLGCGMSNLPINRRMLGQTLAKVVPVTIALALLFSVLAHFWACNPGRPWWRKRELITDICYWFLVPLFARVFRIGFLVLGAALLFGIRDADDLIAFYDNGHGALSILPLWLQAILFLVLADFMMYWLHRMFHGGRFWKYHAIHHSSEDVDWISARFHPSTCCGSTIGDVVLLMTGISPGVMWLRPFNIFVRVRSRQPQLDARPVQNVRGDAGVPSLASPARRGGNTNFAGTFPLWDILFGTFRMQERHAAGPIPAWTISPRFPAKSSDSGYPFANRA